MNIEPFDPSDSSVRDPFVDVTLFKKSYSHVSRDAYMEEYATVTRGNPNYFLTYANGKSAARVIPGETRLLPVRRYYFLYDLLACCCTPRASNERTFLTNLGRKTEDSLFPPSRFTPERRAPVLQLRRKTERDDRDRGRGAALHVHDVRRRLETKSAVRVPRGRLRRGAAEVFHPGFRSRVVQGASYYFRSTYKSWLCCSPDSRVGFKINLIATDPFQLTDERLSHNLLNKRCGTSRPRRRCGGFGVSVSCTVRLLSNTLALVLSVIS